jgi:hypothetical protein
MNHISSTGGRRDTEKNPAFLRVSAALGCAVLLVARNGTIHAQTDSTPLVTWEDVLPARRGAVLWVRNPTQDTVWIDSVHVENCRNIRRGGCGSRAVKIVLPPGGRKQVHRLEPAVPSDAFSYTWFLDWRTAATDSRPRRPRRDSSNLIRT